MYKFALPPNWPKTYLPLWINEDLPTFDYFSLLPQVSETLTDSTATIYLKSEECCLAGVPFIDEIVKAFACQIDWKFSEGSIITKPAETSRLPIAQVTGPISRLLQVERLLLNLLTRCTSIASNTHTLIHKLKSFGFDKVKLAGTRKTTPGFRLVEKYALMVAGADTHRQNLSDWIMLKDNHIDYLKPEHVNTAIESVHSALPFGTKIEIECRNVAEAVSAAQNPHINIVMLDNAKAHECLIWIPKLRQLNPNLVIEVSGGISEHNILDYAAAGPDVISMGSLTQGPFPVIDFSMKLNQ